MIHCVSPNNSVVKELAEKFNIHPAVVAAKVAVWQDANGVDKWPTTEDLGFVDPSTYKDEEELLAQVKVQPKGLLYAEVMLPAWSKEFYEDFVDSFGNIDFDKVQEWVKDGRLPEEVLEMIGYRIPTEAKYSMMPMKVVGFLPIESGGALMMPGEITTIAGVDFDGDKEYVMLKSFKRVAKYNYDRVSQELNEQGYSTTPGEIGGIFSKHRAKIELEDREQELWDTIQSFTRAVNQKVQDVHYEVPQYDYSRNPDGTLIEPANIKQKQLIKSESASIIFEEEQSTGYRNRTIKNASADATIAIAVDFNTPGEKLTKSSVLNQKKKYIAINLDELFTLLDPFDESKGYDLHDANIYSIAEGIVRDLNSVKAKTLNIAGNGIYTVKDKYSQDLLDKAIERLMEYILYSDDLENNNISIRTGGQTGIDEAGAKAGMKLVFPTKILAPKGWKFRDIDGKDISNEELFKARFQSTTQSVEIEQPVDAVEQYKSKNRLEQDGNHVYEYLGLPYTIKKEEFKQFSQEDIYKFTKQLPIEKLGTSKLRARIEDLIDNYLYSKINTLVSFLKEEYEIDFTELEGILDIVKSGSDELKSLNIALPQNHVEAARYIELLNYYNNTVKYVLDAVAEKFGVEKVELTGYGENDMYIPNRILHRNTTVEELESTQQTTQAVETEQPKTINIYAGTDENAELSNFAIRPFTVNVELESGPKEFTFQSVEQGFHFYKALLANNSIVAKKVLQTTNGATLKKLTNKTNLILTPEQVEEWDNTSKSIMLNLMYDSYLQNPDAAKKLLATGNAKITHTQDNTRWKTDFPDVVMAVRGMLKDDSIPTQETEEQPTIKPGVSELFESNLELANAVYEALGFKGERFIKNYPKQIEFNGYTFNSDKLLEIQNAFDYNDDGTIADQRLFKYKNLQEYGMKDNEYQYAKKNEDVLNNLLEAANKEGIDWEFLQDIARYILDKNIKLTDTQQGVLFGEQPNPQITLQQKQQAISRFQEYVNATGKQDIEGFKKFVEKSTEEVTTVDEEIIQKQSLPARNNALLDIMTGILRSEHTVKDIMTPGGFQYLSDIASLIKGKIKSKEAKRSIFDIITTNRMAIQNTTGITLKGIAANHTSHNALRQHYNLKLTVPVLFDGLSLDNLSGKTPATQVVVKDGKVTVLRGDNVTRTVSGNFGEISAAVVDNAKDPVAGYIGYNMQTAGIASVLLGVGYDPHTVFFFLSQPVVREAVKRAGRSNKSLSNVVKAMLKEGGVDKVTEPVNLNTQELYNALNSEKLDTKLQMDVLRSLSMYTRPATDLGRLIKATSADRTGLQATLASGEAVKDLIHSIRTDERFSIQGAEDMFSVTGSHDMIAQFAEQGVIKPMDTLYKVFPTGNLLFTRIKSIITANFTGGKTLDEDAHIFINEQIIKFLTSGFSYFNSDERLPIIENTPQQLQTLQKQVATNPEMKNLAGLFLSVFTVVPKSVKDNIPFDIIKFNTAATISKEQQVELTNIWQDLLDMQEDQYGLKTIATNLIKYAYFTSGMGFGVNGFGHLIPIEALTRILVDPVTKQTWAEYEYSLAERTDDATFVERMEPMFLAQFYKNNYNNTTFVPRVNQDRTNITSISRNRIVITSDVEVMDIAEEKSYQGMKFLVGPQFISAKTKHGREVLLYELASSTPDTLEYIRTNKLGVPNFMTEYDVLSSGNKSIMVDNNVHEKVDASTGTTTIPKKSSIPTTEEARDKQSECK